MVAVPVGNTASHARRLHRLKEHPDADPRLFYVKQRIHSLPVMKRAARTRASQKAVSRITEILRRPRGRGPQHQVTLIRPPGLRRQQQRAKLFCARCKRVARTIGAMDALPCRPFTAKQRGHRAAMVRRYRTMAAELLTYAKQIDVTTSCDKLRRRFAAAPAQSTAAKFRRAAVTRISKLTPGVGSASST